jgi:CubicO group peptidase (beta-lactamase class C family)
MRKLVAPALVAQIALLVTGTFVACSSATVAPGPTEDASVDAAVIDAADGGSTAVDDLGPQLEAIRAESGVPSLAAAAYRAGVPVARGAVGTRKLGEEVPVTTADVWHLGSDTKAMTATLAAMLVDEKKLDWKAKLIDLLPDVPMDPAYAEVPFESLLYHRAGLPANPSQAWMVSASKATDLVSSRKDAVVELLVSKPAQSPGTYVYSNAGYIVAGAILEAIAKEPWEKMMQTRLFAKLGMTSCGFGPPASKGQIDAPWGHDGKAGKYVPVAPGPASDNPLALGPAGTVHCALDDWAKFAHAHARGAKGEAGLVSAESFAKLQTPPPGGDYAMGFGVTKRDWGGGTVLTHSGSNTLFFATVWIAPEKDLVMLAATNAGDDAAAKAVDSAFAPMVEAYAK